MVGTIGVDIMVDTMRVDIVVDKTMAVDIRDSWA
jgi:hypothetical protein